MPSNQPFVLQTTITCLILQFLLRNDMRCDSAQVKLFMLTPLQACESELQLLTVLASKKNCETIKESTLIKNSFQGLKSWITGWTPEVLTHSTVGMLSKRTSKCLNKTTLLPPIFTKTFPLSLMSFDLPKWQKSKWLTVKCVFCQLVHHLLLLWK